MHIQEMRFTQWSRSHDPFCNFLKLEETLFVLTSQKTGVKVSPSMTEPKVLSDWEVQHIQENTETNKPIWEYLEENLSWFEKNYSYFLILTVDNKQLILNKKEAEKYIRQHRIDEQQH